MELIEVGKDAKTGAMVYQGADGKHYIHNPPSSNPKWTITEDTKEQTVTFKRCDSDTVVVLHIDEDGFSSVTENGSLIWSSGDESFIVGLEKAGVPCSVVDEYLGTKENPKSCRSCGHPHGHLKCQCGCTARQCPKCGNDMVEGESGICSDCMAGYTDNPPAGTNHTITASVDGKPVSFNAKAVTLSSEKIDPEETDKDGLPIKTISKIKATGEILGPGDTTREVVNSEGRKVDKSEIVYRLPTPEGGYQVVRKFQKTDALKVEDYLPRSALNDFLVEKQLEFLPKAPEDASGMWELADYLNRTGQVATSVIVLREGWEQYGLLLVPFVDEAGKRFTLIGYLVKKRVEDFTGVEIPAGGSKPVATEVQTGVKSLFKKKNPPYRKLGFSKAELLVLLKALNGLQAKGTELKTVKELQELINAKI